MSYSRERAEMDRAEIALFGREGVSKRRNRGQEISEAHSEVHLSNVSEITQIVGDIYGFTPKEKLLAYSAGWFHDLDRASTEDASVGDECASANEAHRILTEMYLLYDLFRTTPEERDAVAYAIENHSRYPSWLDDPEKREETPTDLKDKLHLALFVADKMEANGVRVIARRSSFVAGDRLKSEKGDLRQFGFQPDRDEALVVALESAIRLSIINPEDIYPERLKPLVRPLYETQREFTLGLLKGLNADTIYIAEIIRWAINQEGKSIADVRKLNIPHDPLVLRAIFRERGGIYDRDIEATSEDTASSALETVAFFSSSYRENLEQLMQTWQPEGAAAKRWQRGMQEYANGTWFNRMREQIDQVNLIGLNSEPD